MKYFCCVQQIVHGSWIQRSSEDIRKGFIFHCLESMCDQNEIFLVLVLAPFFLEEKIFKICILYKKKFNKSVISAIA